MICKGPQNVIDYDNNKGIKNVCTAKHELDKKIEKVKQHINKKGTRTSTVECILKYLLKILNTSSIILYILILTSYSCIDIYDKYIYPILDYSDQYHSYNEEDDDNLTIWNNRDTITYTERECGYIDSTGYTKDDITWTTDDSTITFANDKNKYYDTTFAELMMLHGAGIIPNLLSNNISKKLRDVIIQMNINEPKNKQFDLKEKDHRWSLRINPYNNKFDSNGVIRDSLKEIASNKILYDGLEELLGPNCAITELAAITSEPGAPEQNWHNDVWHDGSSTNYARKYTSQYSLFVYLQDTYEDMGATGFCLGTHMCAGVNEDSVCFNAEVEEGSGVLLNSCIMHQGSKFDILNF